MASVQHNVCLPCCLASVNGFTGSWPILQFFATLVTPLLAVEDAHFNFVTTKLWASNFKPHESGEWSKCGPHF